MTAGWEESAAMRTSCGMDLEWLAACDAILLLPGWEQSQGARTEYEEAVTVGLVIWDVRQCSRTSLESTGFRRAYHA